MWLRALPSRGQALSPTFRAWRLCAGRVIPLHLTLLPHFSAKHQGNPFFIFKKMVLPRQTNFLPLYTSPERVSEKIRPCTGKVKGPSARLCGVMRGPSNVWAARGVPAWLRCPFYRLPMFGSISPAEPIKRLTASRAMGHNSFHVLPFSMPDRRPCKRQFKGPCCALSSAARTEVSLDLIAFNPGLPGGHKGQLT